MNPLDVDAIALHFAPDLVDYINSAGIPIPGTAGTITGYL
jgi:hypothetical protein